MESILDWNGTTRELGCELGLVGRGGLQCSGKRAFKARGTRVSHRGEEVHVGKGGVRDHMENLGPQVLVPHPLAIFSIPPFSSFQP